MTPVVRPQETMEEAVSANWLTIKSLWRAKQDTRQIANMLDLPEWAVYNFFICKRSVR